VRVTIVGPVSRSDAAASASASPPATLLKRQFYGYLLPFGYIERVERGKYVLTEKGQKLLALLS